MSGSTEVACWPNGEKVWVRVRVRAGARECITLVSFFFFLTKCGENLVFVGWVSPEYVTSRERTPTSVNKFYPISAYVTSQFNILSIACIERATMLWGNITRITRDYKAGEGVLRYSRLTN